MLYFLQGPDGVPDNVRIDVMYKNGRLSTYLLRAVVEHRADGSKVMVPSRQPDPEYAVDWGEVEGVTVYRLGGEPASDCCDAFLA